MVACRMKVNIYQHQPVLLDEVLHSLLQKPDGVYVDATFGRGGHAKAILHNLSERGRLLAIDQDQDAIAFARQHFSHDPRFKMVHSSFANLTSILEKEHLLGKVDGILFDLGVSSPQLDDPNRGFSFTHAGLLDMRMDRTQGDTARTLIATVSEKELTYILKEYGEERFAKRIARAIIDARKSTEIKTTEQLAEIIAKAHPAWVPGKHPATRSFQAIRIAVNKELDHLKIALEQSLKALCVGGRLLVISFHSLEDRIVKHFMQQHEQNDPFPAKLPVKTVDNPKKFKRLGKAIKPSLQEISKNPRARSAVLRIGEKLS